MVFVIKNSSLFCFRSAKLWIRKTIVSLPYPVNSVGAVPYEVVPANLRRLTGLPWPFVEAFIVLCLVKTARQKRRGSMIQLNRFIDLYWMNDSINLAGRYDGGRLYRLWKSNRTKGGRLLIIKSCRLCFILFVDVFFVFCCLCFFSGQAGGRPWKTRVLNRSLDFIINRTTCVRINRLQNYVLLKIIHKRF